ncbi:hypothetical protein H8356DRAFT_1347204 [Neocallimastix lanati (nom. inval.)]|nr:hypothetical protein H8356DRAFT_1347204 [Neocallimastix sp. JGI-2020a]
MDNNINIIKRYIEKKDYINLEEILSNFIIPLNEILNKNFDIICFAIKNGCEDSFIKNIYKWYNINQLDYCYFLNNRFISPLLYSFIYKKYELIEFLTNKGANINRKYNNMSLLKYLINNEYFNEENISILVKNKYKFSRHDFEILFQKEFNLIILTFEQITLFNEEIKNDYNNNNNMEKKKRRRFEKEKEKEKIIMQEINIPFMWYIKLFKENKFREITLILKYERSKEKFNGIKFFDHQFKYLNKNRENDIEFHFLHEIIEKNIEIPNFKNGNYDDVNKDIQIRNKFEQILNRKRKLYKRILLNKKNEEIEEFKNNNKFFLLYLQKKNYN